MNRFILAAALAAGCSLASSVPAARRGEEL